MLQLRPLGNSEILVSLIGLGTVKFGRNTAVKYPSAFTLPSDREITELLAFAKDQGVNVLDTAPAYGNSEERLGNLLPKAARKDWVIMTKVGEEFIQGESQYNFTPEHTKMSIERSLKRLKTDYLDAVLVHSDGNDIHNIQHFGILDCLNDLKKAGLIRTTGMSSKTIEGGLFALEQADLVMVTYNPIHTEEKPVIQRAHALKKGVLIKKALASGHLQKLEHPNPVPYALNFIVQEPGVSSIIIGTLNQQHLKEAIEGLDG